MNYQQLAHQKPSVRAKPVIQMLTEKVVSWYGSDQEEIDKISQKLQ